MKNFDYGKFSSIKLPEEKEIIENWKTENLSPLASICCITYNHAKYIEDAIRGFLIQKTDFPFEIIIHDDASNDNTANIIRRYAEKYPRIIKPIFQAENQFSIKRRISALHVWPKVKGEFIALCEGDDYWIDENKLQIQVDFLKNNPDYYLAFGGSLSENMGKFSLLETRWNKNRTEFDVTDYICRMFGHTSSICCRSFPKSWELKCDYDILQGDQHFVLFQSTHGCDKIKYFDNIFSVYRNHPSGITKSEFYNNLDNSLNSYDAILEHFEHYTEGRYNEAISYRRQEIDLLKYLKKCKKNAFSTLIKRNNMKILMKYLLRKYFGLRPF